MRLQFFFNHLLLKIIQMEGDVSEKIFMITGSILLEIFTRN